MLADALVHLALQGCLLDQRGPKCVLGWGSGLVLGVSVLLMLGEDLCEVVRVGLGRPGELGAMFSEEVTKELGRARGVGLALGAQLVAVLLEDLRDAGAVLGMDLLEAQGLLVGSCVQERGDVLGARRILRFRGAGLAGGGRRGPVARWRMSGRGRWRRWWFRCVGTRGPAVDEAEARGGRRQRELER